MLLSGYLGNISGLFELDFGRPIQPSDIIPDTYLAAGIESANRLNEGIFIELGLRILLKNPPKDWETFHYGEWEPDPDGMVWLIQSLLRRWFGSSDSEDSPLLLKSQIVDTPLEDWRANIKPGILQMLKEKGIQP